MGFNFSWGVVKPATNPCKRMSVVVHQHVSPSAAPFLAKPNLAEYPFDTEVHFYYMEDMCVWRNVTVQRKVRRMVGGEWGPVGMVYKRCKSKGCLEFRVVFSEPGRRWTETWRWSEATRGGLRFKLYCGP